MRWYRLWQRGQIDELIMIQAASRSAAKNWAMKNLVVATTSIADWTSDTHPDWPQIYGVDRVTFGSTPLHLYFASGWVFRIDGLRIEVVRDLIKIGLYWPKE